MAERQLATVTSYGPSAGSARVRVFDWLQELELKAESHSYGNLVSNNPKLLMRQPMSVIESEMKLRQLIPRLKNRRLLLSRQASPFSNGNLERKLLGGADIGIYDFDDALMHSPSSGVGEIWSKRKVWRQAVETADIVVAGNDFLANEASAFCNPIVVPSCVRISDYVRKTDYEIAEVPRLLWLGSSSTEKYLNAIAGPLLLAHSITGLRLTLVSAGAQSLGRLDEMIDRVEWKSDTVAAHIASADAGIMPLPDSLWARGKCAYKLLQYGASGLPFIGSPVGANADVLSGAGCPAPTSNSEWVDALLEMVTASSDRRAEQGVAALNYVRENYSYTRWAPYWSESVVGSTYAPPVEG